MKRQVWADGYGKHNQEKRKGTGKAGVLEGGGERLLCGKRKSDDVRAANNIGQKKTGFLPPDVVS